MEKGVCKDVISDVYLYLWQNRKQLPEIQNYENYLFICARNHALKYKSESDKYQKIRLEDADLGGLSEKSTPEQEILDNELKKIIELAINSLPEKCRLIFFMVREENMTYKEVAQILSISDRTVHAQMCIAIRKIGIVIQEYRTGKKIKWNMKVKVEKEWQKLASLLNRENDDLPSDALDVLDEEKKKIF